MPRVNQLISELATHALAKWGTRHHSIDDDLPHIELPGSGMVFWVYKRDREIHAHVPILKGALKKLIRHYPAIRQNKNWSERDGCVFIEVPLDAGLPVELFKSLIDDAYALSWKKLDEAGRRLIDLLIELKGQPYDEAKIIDRLIDVHSLEEYRSAIHKVVRPAILLRTTKSSESEIPSGVTKIGGRPDLPADTKWPIYYDRPRLLTAPRPPGLSEDDVWPFPWICRPLAFLAQIDLAEIARLGTPIKGLPTDGLLSVFSGWGWVDTCDQYLMIPPDADQEEYTVVFHTPPGTKLRRLKTPGRVNSFRAAIAEPCPILSVPSYLAEQSPKVLDLSDVEKERYWRFRSDYRSIQGEYWLNDRDPLRVHHQLGGYSEVSQNFQEHAIESGKRMFLQLTADGNTDMNFGDLGELTFFADAKALAKGRFERIWGDWQCG